MKKTIAIITFVLMLQGCGVTVTKIDYSDVCDYVIEDVMVYPDRIAFENLEHEKTVLYIEQDGLTHEISYGADSNYVVETVYNNMEGHYEYSNYTVYLKE